MEGGDSMKTGEWLYLRDTWCGQVKNEADK
jgi:hypothetical protein